ncbi:MAG TPA: GTP-binding protein [Streptosporangiaceae bacterium]|jgi:Ni2+-binding GTPase involved in maturation of urease and hydrogenase
MIKFIALSGFLGAGKTTTLIATARMLEAQGRRVSVVTNDQGTDLVDTKMARSSLDSVAEVTGGCFCCRFDDLMTVVNDLLTSGTADTVIAEAVGSCTDLQATVVRPLRKYHGERFSVAPLATIVDPHRLRAFARAADRGEPESDLSYLFGRQLAEADVIAINKTDTISAADLDALTSALQEKYPSATVIPYSALTGAGLEDLVGAWQQEAGWSGDLDIDYDRYAAAEAQLAWYNQRFDLRAASGAGFSPAAWASAALGKLIEIIGDPASIGHAKIMVDSEHGVTKLSATGGDDGPSADMTVETPVREAAAFVNARVACDPPVMDQAVLDAVAHADAVAGATSSGAAGAVSFKPGYPRPIHHLAASQM